MTPEGIEEKLDTALLAQLAEAMFNWHKAGASLEEIEIMAALFTQSIVAQKARGAYCHTRIVMEDGSLIVRSLLLLASDACGG